MKLHRPVTAPFRFDATWDLRWAGNDGGLITCWERGREKRREDPDLAARADAGQLVILPWKGGVEKATKKNKKFGSLFYLAMWQGLRGEDLNIDTTQEITLTCVVISKPIRFPSGGKESRSRRKHLPRRTTS